MGWIIVIILIVVYVATDYFDKHGDEDTASAKAATGVLGCFMAASYLLAIIGGIGSIVFFFVGLFELFD